MSGVFGLPLSCRTNGTNGFRGLGSSVVFQAQDLPEHPRGPWKEALDHEFALELDERQQLAGDVKQPAQQQIWSAAFYKGSVVKGQRLIEEKKRLSRVVGEALAPRLGTSHPEYHPAAAAPYPGAITADASKPAAAARHWF